MRRVLLLLVVLLLPALIVVGVLVIQDSQPKSWKVELDKYTAFKEVDVSSRLVLKRFDRATMPWHFSRIMSASAYGENPYFDTDYDYSGERNPGGSGAIPYPPEALWCVLLAADKPVRRPDGREALTLVVVVAEHHDLYNAALVVHEVGSDQLSLAESLALVGCRSVLEEIQFSEGGQWT